MNPTKSSPLENTMKNIHLVRHAQSHANAGGHAMPNADIPITALGQEQAKQVADWLLETLGDDIASISVSEYLRTQQTAQYLLEKTGFQPTIIEGLQEFNYLNFADIEHKTSSEIRDLADNYWLTFEPDTLDEKGAENFNQFVARVKQVQAYFDNLPDGNHVVFTHGLWISMLIWLMLGQPTDNNIAMQKYRQFEMAIRPKNCDVWQLTLSDNASPAITKVRSRAVTTPNEE